MSAAAKEAPTPASAAAKTAAQANVLAAMAAASGVQPKLAATLIAKPAGATAAPEAVEPEKAKAPEIDLEEARFWMKQTVVYVSLFATIVAMGCAHWAGKSFLSTALCGATAAILTGIAGTVVALLSLPQVVAEGPVEETQGK
jgi:hypothetical protein